MNASPRRQGYRMPAEWEPHEATWLSWPHKRESWPGKFETIPPVFVEIVRHLVPSEQVRINVVDGMMEAEVRGLLGRGGVDLRGIRTYRIPTNDAWCRDHGPTFLVRRRDGAGQLALVDWAFNSWGGKYPPFELDDQVPSRIAEVLGIPCFRPGVVMEGGALEVNGAGVLLTTEACLLNGGRNPHLAKGEIEDCLREHLGVSHILWLGEGISGDDTDGHIDELARFVDPSTIVAAVEPNPADENYRPLADNLRRLEAMRDPQGRPFDIVRLPMPPPMFYEGQRLPCSYANFYIANQCVLVPTFGCSTDAIALEILRRLFPRRDVAGIHCRDLVWGLGTLHCVTQQQPGPGGR